MAGLSGHPMRAWGSAVMATERFSVDYDGRALAEHRIAVTDLAPSLLALADMCVLAQELLGDGVAPPPSLDIEASRPGSFDVDLVLHVWETGQDLLLSRPSQTGAQAITILTPVIYALRWLQQRARRGPELTTAPLEPGRVRVTW